MTSIVAFPQDLRFSVYDRAVSKDANRLREWLQDASRPETSIALGDAEEKLKAALASAVEMDARVANATIDYARSFLNALPVARQRSVDVQVEPSGEIICEWAKTSRWILTLAINERGRIAYSGIFGSNRSRGQEHFEGSVPGAVALAIARACQS